MPGRFIEIAEESGAILPIGHWVLREACREVAGWLEAGTAPADMSSASTCRPGRSSSSASSTRSRRSSPNPASIRPSSCSRSPRPRCCGRRRRRSRRSNGVRALGVRTVIDDFGTGYFSLSHLRQFPIDTLKIASEFVQDTDAASKSSALAGAIVAMSRSLDIETVAEGIETLEQADRMRDLGCAYGQGFAFAHPLTGADLWRHSGKAPQRRSRRGQRRPRVRHEPPSARLLPYVCRRLRSSPTRLPRRWSRRASRKGRWSGGPRLGHRTIEANRLDP